MDKKLFNYQLNDIGSLNKILSSFDNSVVVKISIETGEYFYFENQSYLGSELGYENLQLAGLKFWNIYTCINKPFKDCIEAKLSSDYAKIRFQIWLEEMSYKYKLQVNPMIEENLKEVSRVLEYAPNKK
ncbi:MAG: hypothetical protein A2X08_08300 [Bacteroidetes bacterium GWA2_32_17]|nr:MAG: hypothetical protein A2X08_08300 [Bacteroidetes bacterium GWA2_32_17]